MTTISGCFFLEAQCSELDHAERSVAWHAAVGERVEQRRDRPGVFEVQRGGQQDRGRGSVEPRHDRRLPADQIDPRVADPVEFDTSDPRVVPDRGRVGARHHDRHLVEVRDVGDGWMQRSVVGIELRRGSLTQPQPEPVDKPEHPVTGMPLDCGRRVQAQRDSPLHV